MPKLKIVDHDIRQCSQDFEVSEVQWPNHIPIDLEEFWLCSFVYAELLLAFLCFLLIFYTIYLAGNRYPKVIINSTISNKIVRFYHLVKEGPQKCPIYLKLPWIGNISLKFEKRVKSNVQNCFSAVEPRVIFHTRKILPSIHKDAVPTTQQCLVVYQYLCRCDCLYVIRTSLRLQERITQHITKSIGKKSQQKFCLDETAKPKLL